MREPPVPLGSRTMTVRRGVDPGLAVNDERLTNLDVEGLSLAPAGGQVASDAFAQFEIAPGHAARHPEAPGGVGPALGCVSSRKLGGQMIV